MRLRVVAIFICALLAASPVASQQRLDPTADISVKHPAWPDGHGPIVLVDGAHNNLHTVRSGYNSFARLLSNDGFQFVEAAGPFTPENLAAPKILVIVNPLSAANIQNWRMPTPSAFSLAEIETIKAWVENGGSLFLVADHMPFSGASADLATAFGVSFENAFAIEGTRPETFSRKNGRMKDNEVTRGLSSVKSFTGSAFAVPPGATPILTLDGNFRIISPQVAWRFDDARSRLATSNDVRLATLEVGKGRVVIAAEAAMFTAQISGPEGQRVGFGAEGAQQNKLLTLNLLHWLARLEPKIP